MKRLPSPLLELSDEALEVVMAAVQIWCRKNETDVGSPLGQTALRIAAEARTANPFTVAQLVNILTTTHAGDA